MSTKEEPSGTITLHFNLKKDRDRRIYEGIKNLHKTLGENDISEGFLKFLDSLLNSLVDCEEKKKSCEQCLENFLTN